VPLGGFLLPLRPQDPKFFFGSTRTKDILMSLDALPAGKSIPDDVYVVIENPKNTPNIKYEIDKDTGLLFVDRFAPMPMVFPAHYGFINHTLAGDGDPVDAFVYTDIAVVPNCVIRARPVAVLVTEDESGQDAKIICVPHDKLDRRFSPIKDLDDLCPLFREQLVQFYTHYKNLEAGKWVKIAGWQGAEAAKKLIQEGVAAAK
jgi:inorganic pyrophosphatase